MEMLKDFMFLLFGIVLLVFHSIEFIKEVRSIKKIKAKSDDDNIRATVVSFSHFFDKAILQYSIDGIEKKYVYHFYCDPQKFQIGREVILKLSRESRLAYSKVDLIKAFFYGLFAVIVCLCIVFCGIYNIFF